MKVILILLGLIIISGCIGIDEPIGKNQNIAFEVVINNTNLAPNVAGHPPGTGERVSGNVYYANDSAIQLFVFSHASTAGQNGQIALSINDTEVMNTAIRPIGVAENTNNTLSAIIPKGAKYIVNFSNYHHYEWREYPILSGRNGTLSINITQTGGGVSFDGNPVNLNGSSLYNGSINHFNLTNKSLSDHNVTGNLTLYGFSLTNTSIAGNSTNTVNIGYNYEYSDDAVINIRRNVDDTSSIIHGHGFADNSVVTRNISTNGGLGYNSFDSLPTIDTRSNHYAGFQARPNMTSINGTNMTTFYGFYTYPVISKYNLSTFYGLKIFNPTFSRDGNINNSYGIIMETQTNTTDFYSIVTGNGRAGFGTHRPTSQVQINSTNSIGYLDPTITTYDSRGVLRFRLYEGGLTQWYMNNSGTEAGLIAYGFPGGSPGIAILNGTLGNRQDIYIDAVNGGWRLNTGASSAAPPESFWFNVTGDVSLLKVGGGINIKEGTDARMGTCVLTSGSCTVSTNQVQTNSRIFLTSQASAGTPGFLRVNSRSAGVSFTVASSSVSDASTVAWIIIDPS